MDKDEEDDKDGSSAKKSKGDDDASGSLSLAGRTKVFEVGTKTPVQDFEQLLKEGEPLVTTAQQLEQVIMKLLQASFGDQMFPKICECLKAYR